MARYVDGFLLRCRKKLRPTSIPQGGQVWREHGALEYVEV